jgi:uncharacterized protein YbjQ (UPF0145 family)
LISSHTGCDLTPKPSERPSHAATAFYDHGVLVVTTDDIPGHAITDVFGAVSGSTVGTLPALAASEKTVRRGADGESAIITTMVYELRSDALARLETEAELSGANAVVACRFDTIHSAHTGVVEVCAYGTAVTARRHT